MRATDRFAKVVGWAFILAAGFILLGPGGRLGLGDYLVRWHQDRTVRAFVTEQWPRLTEGNATLGSKTGTDRLVLFNDYRCAYCRAFNDTLSAFLYIHPEAAILVRQIPFPSNPTSRSAALAAVCAEKQGRFEAMHAYLFSAWSPGADWGGAATEIGVPDVAAFHLCMDSQEAKARLSADSTWAAQMSVRATPTLVTRSNGVVKGLTQASAAMAEWPRVSKP